MTSAHRPAVSARPPGTSSSPAVSGAGPGTSPSPAAALAGLAGLAEDLSIDRMARGTRDNLAGILLERVFGMALIVALPLVLSRTALGQYYEAMAAITLAGILAVLGLDVGVVRFTALAAGRGGFEEIRSWLRAGMVMGLGISFALAAGLWVAATALAARFHAPELVPAIRIGSLALPLVAATALLVAPAKGLKSMKPAVVAIQVVQPAAQLALLFLLVAMAPTVSAGVWAFTLAAGVALMTAWAMHRRLGLPVSTRADPSARVRAGALFRFAAPVGGMALTDNALLWVDTLLLAAFLLPRDVATYGLVVRMMSVSIATLFTVIQVFGPFAAQLMARGDLTRLESTLRTATRWAMLLGAPVIGLSVVAGPRVVGLLGLDESTARTAILILSVAFLVDSGTGPIGTVLTMSGRSALNLANNLCALVANVGLNLLLIPRLGIPGAALSWAVVIVAVNGARVVEVHRIYRVHPFSRSLLRPIAAAAVASGVALGAIRLCNVLTRGSRPMALIAAVVTFAAVDVLCLWAAGLEPDDRTLVRRVLGRAEGAAG